MSRFNKQIWLSFFIIILLWGSAFPMIKIALHDFSAINLSTIRLLIGAIILILIACLKKMKFPDLKDIPLILLLGFCGFTVYHTALSYGENFVSAGAASLLISITPIFSAILARIFLKEKFTKLGWIGSIIAFIGVATISLGNDKNFVIALSGIVLILLASLGESIYFVFQKQCLDKYGFFPFTVYTIIAGTLFMLMFLPDSWSEMKVAGIGSILSLIYLGVFPTVIPYFALAYTIREVGVSDATISLYLTPIVSLILAYFMVNEIPSLIAVIGGIMTLLGVSFTLKNEV